MDLEVRIHQDNNLAVVSVFLTLEVCQTSPGAAEVGCISQDCSVAMELVFPALEKLSLDHQPMLACVICEGRASR